MASHSWPLTGCFSWSQGKECACVCLGVAWCFTLYAFCVSSLNPAVEQQAIDRVHRSGQVKPCVVYRLLARNTVEEKVLTLQANSTEVGITLGVACMSRLRAPHTPAVARTVGWSSCSGAQG